MELLYVVFLLFCVVMPLWLILDALRNRRGGQKGASFDSLPGWDDYQRGKFTHSPVRESDEPVDIDAYCASLNQHDDECAASVKIDDGVRWDDTILLEPRCVKRWFGRGILHRYYNGDVVTFDNRGRIVEMYIGGRRWKFHERPL